MQGLKFRRCMKFLNDHKTLKPEAPLRFIVDEMFERLRSRLNLSVLAIWKSETLCLIFFLPGKPNNCYIIIYEFCFPPASATEVPIVVQDP